MSYLQKIANPLIVFELSSEVSKHVDCLSYLKKIANPLFVFELSSEDSKHSTHSLSLSYLQKIATSLFVFELSSEDTLLHVLKILNDFSRVSGLKLNETKPEVMWIETSKTSQENVCNLKGKLYPNKQILRIPIFGENGKKILF